MPCQYVSRRATRAIHSIPICWNANARLYSSNAKQNPTGLRVLFCGADHFSSLSLRSLNQLRWERPDHISAIEVVCRPDKRIGRGRKQIREVPIKAVAQELDLPLRQIDTFTGWAPPEKVDLVVAVSFGLLVPPRILNASTYGGLNVHPSLLPEFRGPAPIHHALLQGKTHTGVSVQTMHPKHFDRGLVVAQTPAPGFAVPDGCTVETLVEKLGGAGALMLRQVIEDRIYVDPVSAAARVGVKTISPTHAPKITPADHQIDWSSWTADQVLVRDRVLGRLWDDTTFVRCSHGDTSVSKRVTFHGPWRTLSVPPGTISTPGQPLSLMTEGEMDRQFILPTVDGQHLSPRSITIESERAEQGVLRLLRSLSSRVPG